jgi:hypothetical protein
MTWFGPSKDELWKKLSDEIGADFVAGQLWKGSKVAAHVGPWTITLDMYTVSSGHNHVTYTRMRAPYVSGAGLRFTIYRKGVFSALGKMLGMQDIEVGDPAFDESFIIQGNDEFKVRDLFSNKKIRELIDSQPEIHLSVRDSEGWFGPKFPDDVDELAFQVVWVIKDLPRLKRLYDLFAEVLDQLCRLGAAVRSKPNVTL